MLSLKTALVNEKKINKTLFGKIVKKIIKSGQKFDIIRFWKIIR